jgi:hypothetical protein
MPVLTRKPLFLLFFPCDPIKLLPTLQLFLWIGQLLAEQGVMVKSKRLLEVKGASLL